MLSIQASDKPIIKLRKVEFMLLLSEKEIKSIYTMESAIKDLENALVHNQEGKIQNPHRTVLDFPEKKLLPFICRVPCRQSEKPL